jgi:hypothetical protein
MLVNIETDNEMTSPEEGLMMVNTVRGNFEARSKTPARND